MPTSSDEAIRGTLNLQINLDRPVADLQKVLNGAVAKASLGLRGADSLPDDTLTLPGVFPRVGLGEPLRVRDIREEFKRWLLGVGLRECIDGLEHFLWDTWRVATVVTLPRPDGLVSGSELQRFWTEETKFLEGKHLGQKVVELRRRFPDLVPDRWDRALKGLVQLRNCLTHGRGIVRKRDLTSEKTLFVTWEVLEVELEELDGKRHRLADLQAGPLPAGDFDKAFPTFTWRRRFFRLGSEIHLSVQEFSEIAMSLMHFAFRLRKNLGDHLRSKGVDLGDVDLEPRVQFVVVDLSPLAAQISVWAKTVDDEAGPIEVYLPANPERDLPLNLELRCLDGQPSDLRLQKWQQSIAEQLGGPVCLHLVEDSRRGGLLWKSDRPW